MRNRITKAIAGCCISDESARHAAEHALRELRSPSEGMKLAGARAIRDSMGETNQVARAGIIIQAAIDKALEE